MKKIVLFMLTLAVTLGVYAVPAFAFHGVDYKPDKMELKVGETQTYSVTVSHGGVSTIATVTYPECVSSDYTMIGIFWDQWLDFPVTGVAPGSGEIVIRPDMPDEDTVYIPVTVTAAESGDIEKATDSEVKPVKRRSSSHSGGSASAAAKPFTGTSGKPVSGGTWAQNSDGTWSYSAGQKFADTWGYIENASDPEKASWYYFDKNGRMLTGWQKVYWNGAYRWFYFRKGTDPMSGACQLGGTTPDGYELNPDGSWKEN